MFTTDRDTLVATLLRLRAEVCLYEGDPCDCKYGRGNEPAKSLRPGMTEMTGCPELAQAALIIFQLTEDEFDRYSKNLHGRGAPAMSGFPAEMKRHRAEDRALRVLLGEVPKPEDVADGLRKDYARLSRAFPVPSVDAMEIAAQIARRPAFKGLDDMLKEVEGQSARTLAERAFLDVRYLAVVVEKALVALGGEFHSDLEAALDALIEEMRGRGLANRPVVPKTSKPENCPQCGSGILFPDDGGKSASCSRCTFHVEDPKP